MRLPIARVALLSGVLAAMFLTPLLARAQSSETTDTQAAMRGVFVTLTQTYKYSLDPEQFENPANHERIMAGLNALLKNAAQLEAHTAGLDPSFDYLRRSLANDARDAVIRFRERQYINARFVVGKLTENCLTCHSKLPSDAEFDLGSEFVAEAAIQDLDPMIRVDLELATRQFDAALTTYESLFLGHDVSTATLALIGAFERYLRVCLGVREAPERAIKTLEKFSEREDISNNNRELAVRWVNSIRKLDLDGAKGRELAVTGEMIEKAQAQRKHPGDRSQLVEFVAATALLHRYLERQNMDAAHIAEALYLLGVAESYISRSYWISETDFLLEQAIRTAPGSEVARRAYAFLEDYTVSGQALTARSVPEDLEKRLAEMRMLVDGE